VNEASHSNVLTSEINDAACLLISSEGNARLGVSRLALKKTDEVQKTTGWRENWYSRGAYVYVWVMWLEHESDHKPLHNVEIMSGAIILSIYVSVLRI
jgi:hypothetical protein